MLFKLTFISFTDDKFKKMVNGGIYSVMINPESFRRSINILYNKEQSVGSTSTDGKFDKIYPETYSFDFVIDGTGVSDGEKANVQLEVEHFLKVVYKYKSEKHRPPYVMIAYCGDIMRCVLKSLDISYTLFHPSSVPLRAKVSCTFGQVQNSVIESLILDKRSPDITHKRVVKEGETLISIANEIYNSNRYYMDVAEKNNLNNFRKIKPGTAIYFPPLKN